MLTMNALVLVALSLAQASPDESLLAKGEIVTKLRKVPGSDVEEATAKAVIDAPPAIVWGIVGDCKNYKNTMPTIVESSVTKTERPLPSDGPLATEVRHCRVVADLPFPLPDLVSLTRSVYTTDPGKMWRRQWTMTGGDYNRNEGDWTIVPWGDGQKSLATYRIHAEPKVPLPGSMIASIQERKLPEVMTKLRATAAKRKALAPSAPIPAAPALAPAPLAPATAPVAPAPAAPML